MDTKRFWQYKIVQFFHDPPGKPYASWPGTGGHRQVAAELFRRYTELPLKGYATYPDWAASGADRPLITPPRGKGPVQVHWWKHPVLTHPLYRGYRLDVRRRDRDELDTQAVIKEGVLEDQIIEVERLRESDPDWDDAEQLRRGFVTLWRQFRDELVFRLQSGTDEPARGDLLWAEMPADSRCPDHSIWDHLHVTTALAFLTRRNIDSADHPQAPWLLRFSLGPAQRFIEESRTTRDLWISSFLPSDLIWHAMEPIIDHYGPDCIVYPDLRGNPRADVWLHQHHRDALPEIARNPSTFAAVLPNAFVALLPRGGDEHLRHLEDLAQASQQAVQNHWKTLANSVREWMGVQIDGNNWIRTWDRQHGQGEILYTTWSAVPWLPLEKIEHPETLRGRALPAQRSDFRQPPPELAEQYQKDKTRIRARRDRLAPWVPGATWAYYEWAREVYAFTRLDWHQMERGFDYALTHHQLSARHVLRKAADPDPVPQGDGEPGEKCTLCGKRTALGGEAEGRGIESARKRARKVWANKELDPDERGSERLCAVCATKRFLIESGYDKNRNELAGINRIWAGPETPADEVLDQDRRKVRVPFPSSATLAAQDYLAEIVADPARADALREVNRAHRATGLPRTSFPRALPRLAVAYRAATQEGKEFLMRDTQEVIFPDAVEGLWRYWKNKGNSQKADQFDNLLQAVRKLNKAVGKAPGTRMAVVQLDGDHMHRLLLGERDAIDARWRDVIHPKAVDQILANEHLQAAGWVDLLEAQRLTGPSLHAFVSRTLAEFSHRVVPWVVEREFSGRLVYAGGDDVLCLAPASDALGIAARLQQLYSAPWIIDTDYRADAWAWRRQDWAGVYDRGQARRRFLIPRMPRDGGAIRLPVEAPEELEPHAADPDNPLTLPADGTVLPMLGRGCSLSAGIAYGHFKTPLGLLLRQARRMLNEVAKERSGRRSVALSHYSRNGVKTEFAIRWNDRGTHAAQHRLDSVIEGFRNDMLPGRLPYKLRELMPAVEAALDRLQQAPGIGDEERQARRERLLRGLFQKALDAAPGEAMQEDVLAIWEAGIDLWPDQTQRAVDGLLLCRYLGGGGEDEA